MRDFFVVGGEARERSGMALWLGGGRVSHC